MTGLAVTLVAMFFGGLVLRWVGLAIERAALRRATRQQHYR